MTHLEMVGHGHASLACQGAEIHGSVAEGDRHEEERSKTIVILEKYGQKVMQERKKTYDLACNKMKKGEALTSSQGHGHCK